MIKVVSNRSFRKKDFAEPVETVDLYSNSKEIRIKTKKFNRSGRLDFRPVGGDGEEKDLMRKSLLLKDKDKKLDYEGFKERSEGVKVERRDEGVDGSRRVKLKKTRSRNTSFAAGGGEGDKPVNVELYGGIILFSWKNLNNFMILPILVLRYNSKHEREKQPQEYLAPNMLLIIYFF